MAFCPWFCCCCCCFCTACGYSWQIKLPKRRLVPKRVISKVAEDTITLLDTNPNKQARSDSRFCCVCVCGCLRDGCTCDSTQMRFGSAAAPCPSIATKENKQKCTPLCALLLLRFTVVYLLVFGVLPHLFLFLFLFLCPCAVQRQRLASTQDRNRSYRACVASSLRSSLRNRNISDVGTQKRNFRTWLNTYGTALRGDEMGS